MEDTHILLGGGRTSLIEILNPDFTRELLEAFETIANALNITRVGFDDMSRLRVRAEYLDDGYVRVRDASASIDILEMLREFSWTFYNLAESNKLLSDLTGALSSVGADKLRTSVVDALPESPFNLSKIGGTALTGRDWSGDFAKLQNLDTALSTRASESTLSGLSGKFPTSVALADNLANPTTTIIGAANLGFDGTYWRRIATDTSGRMKVALDSIPNPSNLDVALSTRASEATLSAIKNALASVGTDKIRASIVDSLPAGTNKIGSVDVASLPNPSNLDVALSTRASESTLSSFVGTPDSSPPSKGVVLLGYDGTYVRRVKTTSDGKLLAVLG